MNFHGTHEEPGTAAVMQDGVLEGEIRLFLQNMEQSSQLIVLLSTISKNMHISAVSQER